MSRCAAEQCAFWTGEGCICGVMGLDETPDPAAWGHRDFDLCECPKHVVPNGQCGRMKEDPRTHDLCTQCLFMCSP